MPGVSPNEYFDLGALQSWNFMDWSNNTVDVAHLNAYLDSYAAQCKAQGLSETTLSFAQVCDISQLIKGNFSDLNAGDAIGMLDKNTGNVTVDGKSVFQYIVNRLTQDGLEVGLSFGGADASSTSWDFGFGSTPPATLASQLATWAQSMGLSSIDFDVEIDISSNGASQLAQFFHAFHQDMSKEGLPVTLTVMGDASTWGLNGSVFGQMFAYGKTNGFSFQDMFDGLNLMLYNGQYYLNAGQSPKQSWDLATWVEELESNTGLSAGQCASFLDIGFNANINYADPSSSGGPLPYSNMPAGLTNGQAAAYIFAQLEKELRVITGDPTLTLGQPFFWDDNADYNVSSSNNYQSDFFTNTKDFEEDFFSYLKTLAKQERKSTGG